MSKPFKNADVAKGRPTRREVVVGACAALALPSVMVTTTATVKADTIGAVYPPGWMDKVEYEAFMKASEAISMPTTALRSTQSSGIKASARSRTRTTGSAEGGGFFPVRYKVAGRAAMSGAAPA